MSLPRSCRKHQTIPCEWLQGSLCGFEREAFEGTNRTQRLLTAGCEIWGNTNCFLLSCHVMSCHTCHVMSLTIIIIIIIIMLGTPFNICTIPTTFLTPFLYLTSDNRFSSLGLTRWPNNCPSFPMNHLVIAGCVPYDYSSANGPHP